MLDSVDIIRVPTVRGHLRFWWRALNAYKYESAEALYQDESELWGRGATENGGRSAVEVRIVVQNAGRIFDESDINSKTPGAYALWPARAERKKNTQPAPRFRPGIGFRLEVVAPKDRERQLRDVIRAWVLFGGYGSRTRRGLGSFTVTSSDKAAWLPAQSNRGALERLFNFDIFLACLQIVPGDIPRFSGASLYVGNTVEKNAQNAWTIALGWLEAFRQGYKDGPGDRAREPDPDPKPGKYRPSISNWPEADKLRCLTAKVSGHPPHHNGILAWPRAGFGLPIAGQFQSKTRGEVTIIEPPDFELIWRMNGQEYDRLASPLIVKALPLANGMFVPCALWMNRVNPAGEVLVRGMSDSGAPFDRLVAQGDAARFSALTDKANLREAFLDWLHATRPTTVVAP